MRTYYGTWRRWGGRNRETLEHDEGQRIGRFAAVETVSAIKMIGLQQKINEMWAKLSALGIQAPDLAADNSKVHWRDPETVTLDRRTGAAASLMESLTRADEVRMVVSEASLDGGVIRVTMAPQHEHEWVEEQVLCDPTPRRFCALCGVEAPTGPWIDPARFAEWDGTVDA